jgi:hypothetical protein
MEGLAHTKIIVSRFRLKTTTTTTTTTTKVMKNK